MSTSATRRPQSIPPSNNTTREPSSAAPTTINASSTPETPAQNGTTGPATDAPQPTPTPSTPGVTFSILLTFVIQGSGFAELLVAPRSGWLEAAIVADLIETFDPSGIGNSGTARRVIIVSMALGSLQVQARLLIPGLLPSRVDAVMLNMQRNGSHAFLEAFAKTEELYGVYNGVEAARQLLISGFAVRDEGSGNGGDGDGGDSAITCGLGCVIGIVAAIVCIAALVAGIGMWRLRLWKKHIRDSLSSGGLEGHVVGRSGGPTTFSDIRGGDGGGVGGVGSDDAGYYGDGASSVGTRASNYTAPLPRPALKKKSSFSEEGRVLPNTSMVTLPDDDGDVLESVVEHDIDLGIAGIASSAATTSGDVEMKRVVPKFATMNTKPPTSPPSGQLQSQKAAAEDTAVGADDDVADDALDPLGETRRPQLEQYKFPISRTASMVATPNGGSTTSETSLTPRAAARARRLQLEGGGGPEIGRAHV